MYKILAAVCARYSLRMQLPENRQLLEVCFNVLFEHITDNNQAECDMRESDWSLNVVERLLQG